MIENKDSDLGKINAQLLQVWQSIKLSGWSTAIAIDLASSVARLARVCSQNQYSDLGDQVLDIEIYLSSFVDSDLIPDTGQLKVLQGLIRDCRSAIRATQRDESRASKKQAKTTATQAAVADGSNKTAFILKSDEDQYAALAAALGTHQFLVRPFLTSADLLEALETAKPSVLILQRQFIDTLDSIDQKLYRDTDAQSEHTAIIVLSSDNSPDERLRAMRAGVDAFIPEPFTEVAVLAQIESLLTDDQVKPFKVLIIDDDRQQAIICSAILRRKGMVTQICTSGREALDQLSDFDPDLIVVDLHMPEMDGLQFTAQVREQQDYFTVPIIFLSGDDDPQTRFDALSLGGNDFLIKPIRPNHLIAAVWSRLKFSRKLRRYLGHPTDKDEKTGLYQFSRLLELGENLFEAGVSERQAYLFQIGLGNVEELEERFGATEILELQRHLASFIVSQFRKMDVIASQRYFLFSALVEDLTEQQVGDLATRMLGQVKGRLLRLDRFTFSTSLCIGICKLNDAIGDMNHAVKLAARACQEAGVDGGNKWLIHKTEGVAKESRIKRFLQLIQSNEASAFDNILFQPMARLNGKRANQYRVGLWERAAENVNWESLETNQLDHKTRARLDLWLLARGLKRIRQARPEDIEMHVHVPLGLETINDDMFVDFVEAALDSARIKPSCLTVVLSHKLAVGAIDSLVEALESVHKLGVKIGLEGITGRKSELEFIERFPIASIELGGDMLSANSGDEGGVAAVGQAVNALHQLGVEVLAPGVEDSDGFDQLRKWGMDYAYGDFVQAPMVIANFNFD